ncbi:MAG: outer membrane beta-barrel protein [Phycisphaeraceae bacterium]
MKRCAIPIILGLLVVAGWPAGAMAAEAAAAAGGDAELRQRVEALEMQIEQMQRQGRPTEHGAGHRDGAGGYGGGLDFTAWVWLTYLYESEPTRSTFWAWEVELAATHSFTPELAATFELDFVDMNDSARVTIEQAFLSMVLARDHGTVLTVGKFNAPFGMEPRDFWDRTTGSTSLLFRAMPRDLVGVILTQPIGDFTLQPLVVNGFEDNLDSNHQPSVGLVVAWEPSDDLRLAVTNYYGPEMADRVGEKLYLLVVEGTWYVTPVLSVAGEYLYGSTEAVTGRQTWSGVASEMSLDLSERWRVFGRWSYLHDPDGFVMSGRRQQEFGVGVALYLHPEVECRAEYRRDWINPGDNRHSVLAHVTFGF